MLAVIASTLLFGLASASPLFAAANNKILTTSVCKPTCAVGAATCATFSTTCLSGYLLQSNGTCTRDCHLNPVANVPGTISVTATAAPFTSYGMMSSSPNAGVYGAFNDGTFITATAQQSLVGSLFRTLTVSTADQLTGFPFLGIATYGGVYWSAANVSYGIISANAPAGTLFPGAVVYIREFFKTFAVKLTQKRAAVSNAAAVTLGENAVWKLGSCTSILTPFWTNPGGTTILKLDVLIDLSTLNLVVTTNYTEFIYGGAGLSTNLIPVTLTFMPTK